MKFRFGLLFAVCYLLFAIAPPARAAALQNVSDVISTSNPSQKAVHTISLSNQNQIPQGGKILITFPKAFSFNGLTPSITKAYFLQGSSVCTFTISSASNRITCTIGSGSVGVNTNMTFFLGCSANSGTQCSIPVPTIVNPTKVKAAGEADIYTVNVKSTNSSDTEIDYAKTKVAIVESVVDSALDTSGPTPPPSTKVEAKVGDFYLNLSGLSSPFASVVLSSSGDFLASTVANSQGFFSINNVLVKKGFSGFCLLAVDFKKIGDSYTCISIPPANENVTKNNIFLPPTLGLSKSQVGMGEDVSAFGYTMPGAEVFLDFGRGIRKTVFADTTGYYVFRIGNLPSGRYELFATSKYKELTSLSPTKKVELRSLSLWEQIISFMTTYWFIWLALLIIGLILIFRRFWPGRFTSIYHRLPIILPRAPEEKPHLHHFWLFGY